MSETQTLTVKCKDGTTFELEEQALLQALEGYLEELNDRIDHNAFYIEREVFSLEFKSKTIARRDAVHKAITDLRNSMVEHIHKTQEKETKEIT